MGRHLGGVRQTQDKPVHSGASSGIHRKRAPVPPIDVSGGNLLAPPKRASGRSRGGISEVAPRSNLGRKDLPLARGRRKMRAAQSPACARARKLTVGLIRGKKSGGCVALRSPLNTPRARNPGLLGVRLPLAFVFGALSLVFLLRDPLRLPAPVGLSTTNPPRLLWTWLKAFGCYSRKRCSADHR